MRYFSIVFLKFFFFALYLWLKWEVLGLSVCFGKHPKCSQKERQIKKIISYNLDMTYTPKAIQCVKSLFSSLCLCLLLFLRFYSSAIHYIQLEFHSENSRGKTIALSIHVCSLSLPFCYKQKHLWTAKKTRKCCEDIWC